MAWAPDYSDLAGLKGHLRIPVADTEDDDELALALTAGSRDVDQFCGRQFGLVAAPETRFYRSRYDRHADSADLAYVVVIDDLMTETGLVVTSAGEVTTEFTLYPLNAPAKGRPWTRIRMPSASTLVEIAGRWGWTDPYPSSIDQATHLVSARIHQRRDAIFGFAGSPEDGSEARLASKLDVDARRVLAPFIRYDEIVT